MSEYKIDKGIPVPEPNVRGRTSKYPFRQMEVGDSVFIPRMASTISGLLSQAKPMKFTTRTATEDGIKGTRVWRVE